MGSECQIHSTRIPAKTGVDVRLEMHVLALRSPVNYPALRGSDAGRTMMQCPITQYEAQRTLITQVRFQEDHDRQASSDAMLRKMFEFIMKVIDLKGRSA